MRYTLVTSQNGISRDSKVAPRSKKATKMKRMYTIIVALLSLLFLGYIVISSDLKPVRIGRKTIDSIAFSFNLQKPIYAVIIDAGSTGSRVLAFSFHESILDANLILDAELYHQITPGLSSFADEPHKAAESLTVLLDKAKSVIPRSEWSRTPLSMKATAGLRLLPGHKANDILKECSKLFETSGFLVSKNSVAIMDGTDEGIFSWFTVNFLQDRLRTHGSDAVAALDLGGGSTQVTFAPDNANIKNQEKYIYAINVFNHNMSVYTHSYLGMGLMAARKEIITHGMNSKSNKDKNAIEIRSECINPIVSTEWHYGGLNYIVKGPENGTYKIFKTQNFAGAEENRPVVRFSECLKIVKNYVSTITNRPLGLSKHEIYAFSYYFDRATEAGLIDPFTGGVIKVDKFIKAAVDSCDYPNIDQPFACLDLTFIYVLLTDGFGLEPTTKLYLYRKINGHELSWAMGAAFNILQNEL
ncbi:ectonucleoside triphosphate diphosphohydrolase 5 isoform X2 [Cephus cinctus]|uniref:Ectonucleoside triphosphate diphosphohydrolase 5 isoform X2 n=1 Tax=Cephus cinctus TaxID=211228 RepID=A0AAJ7BK67_CEPCN|nr:ectonucleoside triphosphate diphosphohydrolase 5 isoform X2 [Cephus cinctus]